MNRFFLKAASDADLGGFMSPERLELAGQVVLIGMGMVFAVLALLWGILAIFGKVMSRQGKQTGEPAPTPEALDAQIVPAVSEPEPAVAETDDGELIAVITAAVAAAIESDEVLSSRFASGFRVVSFKKSARSARGN